MTGPRNTDPAAAPASPAAPAPRPEDALPPFLYFTPVPVKPRHDGWSHAVQLRFVLAIARGAGVDEAARSVGRARVGAYRLRRRAGAESFAAAWDSAAAFAQDARYAAHARRTAGSSIETLLVPRYYRGRLIGYAERENVSGAMGRVAVLDRLAARIEAEGRTEELRALSEWIGPFLDQRIQR
jgi:hypothetical protein